MDHGREVDEMLQGFPAGFSLMLKTTRQNRHFLLHEGFEPVESFRQLDSDRYSPFDRIVLSADKRRS